ncbi:hypothetical protein BGW80DRAFT_1446338 [Lactifluus volemus]|nr:hypothetical protein BGW80DRAFT_1446338 [Lactifluus volemus]
MISPFTPNHLRCTALATYVTWKIPLLAMPQAQPFLLEVASGSEYSEELVAEQLARNYAFLSRSTRRVVRGGAESVETTQYAAEEAPQWSFLRVQIGSSNNIKAHGSWHKVGPDPTRIQIADLSVPCANAFAQSSPVTSDDVTLLLLVNSELAKGAVDELAPLRDFRVCVLPVLLPAVFGLHIAT